MNWNLNDVMNFLLQFVQFFSTMKRIEVKMNWWIVLLQWQVLKLNVGWYVNWQELRLNGRFGSNWIWTFEMAGIARAAGIELTVIKLAEIQSIGWRWKSSSGWNCSRWWPPGDKQFKLKR